MTVQPSAQAHATPKDLESFKRNQFWGEKCLENYVAYSSKEERKWGLPTLNMIAFIPMALIQGCLSPVFGSISAFKNVCLLRFKSAITSVTTSFATSANCFMRIGKVFRDYITLRTPKHSDFWPHTEGFDKDHKEFQFQGININANHHHRSLINSWTDKAFLYFAYVTNSHSHIFDHTMTRFEAAISEGLKNMGEGKAFIIEFKAGTPQNNPPEVTIYRGWKVASVWYDVTEGMINSRSEFTSFNEDLKGKFTDFKWDKVRMDKIAPCLSPSQRRLMVNMVTSGM